MSSHAKRFLAEEKGPTAVEYAIMLALVALAIAVAAPNIHDAVVAVFTATTSVLQTL